MKIGDLPADGRIPDFYFLQRQKKEKARKKKAVHYRFKKKYPEYTKKQIDVCYCGCTRGHHSPVRCSRKINCHCSVYVFHHAESVSIRLRSTIHKPMFDVYFESDQLYPKEEISI